MRELGAKHAGLKLVWQANVRPVPSHLTGYWRSSQPKCFSHDTGMWEVSEVVRVASAREVDNKHDASRLKRLGSQNKQLTREIFSEKKQESAPPRVLTTSRLLH